MSALNSTLIRLFSNSFLERNGSLDSVPFNNKSIENIALVTKVLGWGYCWQKINICIQYGTKSSAAVGNSRGKEMNNSIPVCCDLHTGNSQVACRFALMNNVL